MPRIAAHPILSSPETRQKVRFLFDGNSMTGFAGEPVASALVAAGVHTFSLHAKDGAPQGLFCANGQCSQCTVLIDGIPKKACVTPLSAGMEVRTLKGLPALAVSDEPLEQSEKRTLRTDILVIGAGPSGLSAAYELGRMGFQVIVADDKDKAGGKLVLQTHKFFGSEEDCYAGTRGMDIAVELENRLRRLPNVTLLKSAPVVAVFKDRKAGIYKDYSSYVLVEFTALVVATGAREKGVLFPGSDLPGVYGAGAFQTLVNRDGVQAAKRVFIVGSGNVGLIAAYHALQAGIEVAGIAEIMGKINGYRVHADKIRRLGVPIHLNTMVIRVEGDGVAERVVTAKVDDQFRPVPGTELIYDVDTVLIATGLASCDEFLRQAQSYGILAVAAGDADEIAEASSAMFGGRIAALALAKMLGKKVQIDESWLAKRNVLKSRPGDSFTRSAVVPGPSWRPVFFCAEEIPCNPCATVCPASAIKLRPIHGTIMDLPYFEGDHCLGCMACVSVCPGLSISLVRSASDGFAEIVLPWEFNADFPEGQEMDLVDMDGVFLERAPVISKRYHKKNKTWLLTFRVSLKNAASAAGVCVQGPEITRGRPKRAVAGSDVMLPGGFTSGLAIAAANVGAAVTSGGPDTLSMAENGAMPPGRPAAGAAMENAANSRTAEPTELDAYVCRCERVTLREIVQFIKDNNVRDVNQLKSLRVGMGACGGKTCSQLLGRAFKLAGVNMEDVEPATVRPLFMEVPMGEIVNEGLKGLGNKEAGRRGAP